MLILVKHFCCSCSVVTYPLLTLDLMKLNHVLQGNLMGGRLISEYEKKEARSLSTGTGLQFRSRIMIQI